MNEKLRQLLRKAQGFEAKSERLAKLDPDQLSLALEDIEQMIAKAGAMEEKTQAAAASRKRRINRGALPAHLPRIHERVAPADTSCPVVGIGMRPHRAKKGTTATHPLLSAFIFIIGRGAASP